MDDVLPTYREPNVWIVVPAYNEGEVIESVIREVVSAFGNVVVVDDYSTDQTGQAALRAGAHVLRHPINLGQGAALQTGFDYALAHGADYVVTFDADGQHRVEDVRAMLAMALKDGYDVVVGSRFLGSAINMPKLRRFMLKMAVIFTRVTSGVKLTDAHNGLRVLSRSALQHIHITQNRMAHASEIANQIGAHRLKLAEAPVTIIYSEYSLRKGQKLSNFVNILTELLIMRISR